MSDTASGTSGGSNGTSGSGDGRLLLSIGALVLVFSIVNATSGIMEAARNGDGRPPWHDFLYEFSSAAIWLALTPLFIRLQRRWPFQAPWLSTIALHAAITIPVSLAHVAGMVAIRKLGFAWAYGDSRAYEFLGDTPAMVLFYEWRKDVLTYVMLSGVIWAWDRFRRPAATPADSPERIEIREGARTTFLPAADVYWIEAAGNYVEVHAAAQTHLVRGTLASFEERLSGRGFVRIHRSRLVNRARIRSLVANDAGDFIITLDDGRTLGGSRRYRGDLAALPAL